MESERIKTRSEFLLRWSPLFVAVSLAALLVSLWHAPISASYLLASAAIGMVYGLLMLFGYWRTQSTLTMVLCTMILVGGRMITQEIFFPVVAPHALGWKVSFQYYSIVVGSVFVLAWVFRAFIRKSRPETDVEQTI